VIHPDLASRLLAARYVTESGCWEWTKGRDKDGYGRIAVNRRDTRAHRLAYQCWVGEIPEGHVVRHKCDNPPCINPEHLETGTNADNMRDKRIRMRSARGVGHGWSKLTEDQVRYIRAEYTMGNRSQQSIADEMGVSQVHVSDIVRRVLWTHI